MITLSLVTILFIGLGIYSLGMLLGFVVSAFFSTTDEEPHS